jgi:hypothetical protein
VQSLLELLVGGWPAGLKFRQVAWEEGAQVLLADRALMGKLVKPSQLPVHRGLDDRKSTRLLVPCLPDDLNQAGRQRLALPPGERLIEPAEELSQRIRHSVLTGQNAPTQHDDGPASPATCNVTSVAFGIAAGVSLAWIPQHLVPADRNREYLMRKLEPWQPHR